MPPKADGAKQPQKEVAAFVHEDAKRRNLPTAEYQSIMRTEEQQPIRVAFDRTPERTSVDGASEIMPDAGRRDPDLDPQMIWRGKYPAQDEQLVVPALPLYIQEKVNPKAIIDDLRREAGRRKRAEAEAEAPSLFADQYAQFNGLPNEDAKTEFYRHDAHWSNRMILGDSLQVMASLAEREGLRGKVQCIYLDPPYGIKFNSNFQWSTTSRDVKDGNVDHITREPEQVKAFRDTWRDGIHSYLTYLRDRLTVARELLTESGSIFVQIGDENVHRVRAVMDEVFGDENFVSQITVRKTTSEGGLLLGSTLDFILWFARSKAATKSRSLYGNRSDEAEGRYTTRSLDGLVFRLDNITSSRSAGAGDVNQFLWNNALFDPGAGTFKTTLVGMERIGKADRFQITGKGKLSYRRFQKDFSYASIANLWADISGAVQSRSDPKVYVVQTSTSIIQRCLLLTTDPGDLVLDPTCGSGTTAYVAEQWGRRWITIDTSRVALALARARVMGARYPYYLLSDSPEGQRREAELTKTAPSEALTQNKLNQGFVYERVPHITLKSIANNAEIDVIYDDYQTRLEPLRAQLNASLGESWEEWQIPPEAPAQSPEPARNLHAAWWKERIGRQRAIDKSIAAKAESEYLYDKPFEDKRKVRVAGPFTVESLSPHRVLAVDENDTLREAAVTNGPRDANDFAQVMLETLRIAGVQQAHKGDRISFSSLTPWPGELICAEGRYEEADGNGASRTKRAGILIGPEFGTVTRLDLIRAAREAGDAGFDVLIACAFAYDAQSAEVANLGRIRVLKARMNADLHMATDLKNTGKGNLFVIFGEPDIELTRTPDGLHQVRVRGVDVFQPSTGEVRSSGPEGIACWFLDTDYNEESFFVRHAYFLGASDPYKSLKTTLKAEIDEGAWASLLSDTSRPFQAPESGRIAVKVINHLGDEVMKVLRVQ